MRLIVKISLRAETQLCEDSYQGERRDFTLETYYDIMSRNLNFLDLVGAVHSLTEEQKGIKFEFR